MVSEDAITHLSPAHFEAINSDGTLAFDIASVLKRSGTLDAPNPPPDRVSGWIVGHFGAVTQETPLPRSFLGRSGASVSACSDAGSAPGSPLARSTVRRC